MLGLLQVAIPAVYALAILLLTAYGGHLLWLSLVHARSNGNGSEPETTLPTPEASWPVVTVQVPLYNEAEVAERIVDACAELNYPTSRLEIQILDDSTDVTTDRVAKRVRHWQDRGLDIVHVRRDSRDGYKAGALANGLQSARGTLIAIFDADFVPPPDFLQRMVPRFLDDPSLGLAQARWDHLNRDDSLLTKVQAVGLDAHFAVEQHARNEAGCFMNFNGTAGVWRCACIEDAGGWSHDTLTEDLDLSYRAQLRGWDFEYVPTVAAPAELPPDMNALRSQQFRWAKGGIETALKLLGRLWRSGPSRGIKLAGTFHLTSHLAYPALLAAAVTHVPLLLLTHLGYGPGAPYFGALALGLVGFIGFLAEHVRAQRTLHRGWPRRLALFPAFMAGTIGLSLSNTNAVWHALRGTDTAFLRTPKYGAGTNDHWWESRYAVGEVPRIVWGEVGLAVYATGGLVLTAALGQWVAVPFQAFIAVGFALVAGASLRQAVPARPRGTRVSVPASSGASPG